MPQSNINTPKLRAEYPNTFLHTNNTLKTTKYSTNRSKPFARIKDPPHFDLMLHFNFDYKHMNPFLWGARTTILPRALQWKLQKGVNLSCLLGWHTWSVWVTPGEILEWNKKPTHTKIFTRFWSYSIGLREHIHTRKEWGCWNIVIGIRGDLITRMSSSCQLEEYKDRVIISFSGKDCISFRTQINAKQKLRIQLCFSLKDK